MATSSPDELAQYGQMLRDNAIGEAHIWYYQAGPGADAQYRAIKAI